MTARKAPAKKPRPQATQKSEGASSLPVVDTPSPIVDGVGYLVAKAINLPQLSSEIAELGDTPITDIATTGPESATDAINDSNPITLWVAPSTLPALQVAEAVSKHQPAPDWGIPTVILEFNADLAALRENPEMPLSAQMQESLLRGLALNFSMIVSPPLS